MKLILTLLIFCLLPQSAYAHLGLLFDFEDGLLHPVLGIDHLLAMIGVGIISYQMGGRSIWKVPTTFVLVMAIGGALGMHFYGLVAYEFGIAASVVVLGIAIATNAKLHTISIYGFVALFATFHGYAHGLEIPELAISYLYIAGFMSGTALLHLFGVGIGRFASRYERGPEFLRYTGAGIAGIGIHIILGMAGY